MTHQQIISDLYISRDLDDCIRKTVRPDHQDDFKQELFLIILKKPEELILDLYARGKFQHFVVRTLFHLVYQKRNVYHKTYLDNRIEYDTEKMYRTQPPSDYNHMEERKAWEHREERLVDEVSKLDERFNTPYYRMLVDVVNEHGSQREAARQTGIDVSVISRGIKKVREHLKKI